MPRKLPTLTLAVTKPTGTRKLSESTFHRDPAVRWSRHERVRLNGTTGSLYFCDTIPAHISGENYSNVIRINSRTEYAPEQIRPVVFIADKAIR